MKITFLLVTADAGAGTERAIITQANAMARRGHHVEILSVFRDNDRPHFPTSRSVHRRYAVDRRGNQEASTQPSQLIPPSWDGQFTTAVDKVFPALLRSCASDIVVAPTPPLAALAAQFLPGNRILVQQEHRATQLRGSSRGPLDQYISQVDCLVLLTQSTKDWVVEEYVDRAPRLEVIPNCIPSVFRPQASSREHLIVSAGRLVGGKRFDHLIRAFAMTRTQAPDWRLRIYGSGPRRGDLHRLINALDLTEVVEIVPNITDMLREWPKGSIAALTSTAEGLPLVGLEAIAAGLPFVSYDCPTGPAAIILDGRNGRLVPDGDLPAFASALTELMTDDDLRARMSRGARESAARFDEEAITDRWEGLFGDLLADQRRNKQRSAAK